MRAGAIQFSVHQRGAAVQETPEAARVKAALVELYESRARRRVDLFTGRPTGRKAVLT
jgi:hypothetical protein